MTNHVHAHARAGSSLFQARNTHHNHRHLHSLEQHYQDQKRDSGSTHHIRSSQPQHENIENRQVLADVDPVVVVQTISVVQVIDGNGAIIEVSTIFSDSIAVETPVTPAVGTVDVGVGVAVSASLSLSADLATTSTSPSATVSDGSPSAATTAETVHVTNSSSSSPSDEATLTSAPLPSSTDGLSLPASFNSTTSRQPSLFSNSTLFRTLFANSTTSSSNLFPSATDALASSATLDGSVSVEVVTVIATVTPDAGGSGDGVSPGSASPSASTVPATSTGLPKETQNAVIGSVVGVAGMALIVFLAMIILRWKRQQGGGPTRLRDRSSSVTGRALPAPGGGGSRGGAGAMAERSVPFSIPSALAALTTQKRRSGASHSAGPPSGEKGFYRVSGKKLAPVILSGGDGFSDPHESMRTDVSFYRDSQGFFPGSGALQLGSPMRPESGVPIMRSGPGRTPVQEQNPFSDHAHPLTPPPLTPPARDPLGRSLISQDGSRGSGSRFTEEI